MSSPLLRALLRRRLPVGLIAGVGVALMMACRSSGNEEDDTQFREDVIYCEEAVAHLEECCDASFDARQITCRHFYSRNEGCGNTTIERIDPAYTTDESKCIFEQSCATIRERKICERALAAGQARTSRYETDGVSSSTSTTSGSNLPPFGTSTSSSGVSSSTSTTSGSSTSGPICP